MEMTVVSPGPNPNFCWSRVVRIFAVGDKLESIKSWKYPVSIVEFAGEAQMAYSLEREIFGEPRLVVRPMKYFFEF